VALFERRRHTFVGPLHRVAGMTCSGHRGGWGGSLPGTRRPDGDGAEAAAGGGEGSSCGVRPSSCASLRTASRLRIVKVSDTGRLLIVEAKHADSTIKLLVNEGRPCRRSRARAVDPPTRRSTPTAGSSPGAMDAKTPNQKAWCSSCRLVALVRLQRRRPAHDVVNYSVQETSATTVFFFEG